MSLTGAIYKLTNEQLNIQIENNFSNLDSLKEEADLSYFAIDFLEILSSYSNFERNLIGKILQGNNTFNPDDGFIGYSNATEVKADKKEILDKITIEDFNEFLNKGLTEKNPHTPKNNIEYLQKYYKSIKNAYEKASSENNGLIFRLG